MNKKWIMAVAIAAVAMIPIDKCDASSGRGKRIPKGEQDSRFAYCTDAKADARQDPPTGQGVTPAPAPVE
jgi:hypothetical protein